MTQHIKNSKRTYGYMSCMAIMFAMALTYPSQTKTKTKVRDVPAAEGVLHTDLSSSSMPIRAKRVYYIDSKPVTVDTSKQGWAVDLLIEDPLAND